MANQSTSRFDELLFSQRRPQAAISRWDCQSR
jgi:hypothetical protein